MIKQNINELITFQFENLSKFEEIRHFITTRHGGVSKPPFDSLNLSFKSNNQDLDDPKSVLENRRILSEAIGTPIENFTYGRQVHQTNVAYITEQQRGAGSIDADTSIQDTDSLIANEPDIALNVFAADCVPILLFDPVKKAIGTAHAGWKGTVGKIVQNTISRMTEESNTDPSDLIVGIGPSIGPESYEVDTPVIEKFKDAGLEQFIKTTDATHGMLNLWETNKFLLTEVGVQESNIEIAEMDTYQMEDTFFSDRCTRPTGRFIASIMLV
jgi:polyphenol oxidase